MSSGLGEFLAHLEGCAMDRGNLLMSQEERTRMVVLSRIRNKELSLEEGSQVIGVCYRQARRLMQRFIAEGDVGLVHRGCGRPSGRQLDPAFRLQVLDTYKACYRGFGATLASEKLAERDGLQVDRGTLRRWLMAESLLERTRKRASYRKQRRRRAHFGELVQMDGSDHNWYGDRGDRSCLMNMVDDAKGTTLSFMSQEETTWAAMTVLAMWIKQYGVPRALYVDAKNVYVTKRSRTQAEDLSDADPVTQFGRACQKLSIRLITARSPQAKGRVERNHGTYQDRFVKELFLEHINDVEGANNLLPKYLKTINGKFSKEPTDAADYHRPWPEGLRHDDVFCLEETRVIGKDWVVRYDNRYYQILKQPHLPATQSRVIVRETQNGKVRLLHNERALDYRQITQALALARPTLIPQTARAKVDKPKTGSISPFNRKATDTKEARMRQNQWEAGEEVIAALIDAQSPIPEDRCLNATIVA